MQLHSIAPDPDRLFIRVAGLSPFSTPDAWLRSGLSQHEADNGILRESLHRSRLNL